MNDLTTFVLVSKPEVSLMDASEKTKVAACQMDGKIFEVEANVQHVADLIREAATQEARLIVFPECTLSGWSIDSLEEARHVAIPTKSKHLKSLHGLCDDYGVYCAVGFIENAGDGRLFNSLILLGPKGYRQLHRKIHISHVGVDRFVLSGDIPFRVHELDFGRVGMHLCYDHNFPESGRVMALQGA